MKGKSGKPDHYTLLINGRTEDVYPGVFRVRKRAEQRVGQASSLQSALFHPVSTYLCRKMVFVSVRMHELFSIYPATYPATFAQGCGCVLYRSRARVNSLLIVHHQICSGIRSRCHPDLKIRIKDNVELSRGNYFLHYRTYRSYNVM